MSAIRFRVEVSQGNFEDFYYEPDFNDLVDYLEDFLEDENFEHPNEYETLRDYVVENLDELVEEYDYLLESYFEAEAKDFFREQNEDPYSYHGVSRRDFY